MVEAVAVVVVAVVDDNYDGVRHRLCRIVASRLVSPLLLDYYCCCDDCGDSDDARPPCDDVSTRAYALDHHYYSYCFHSKSPSLYLWTRTTVELVVVAAAVGEAVVGVEVVVRNDSTDGSRTFVVVDDDDGDDGY